MKNNISIVYICDEKYVMPTCVSIQSIYENRKVSVYDIYIIGVDLSQKSKNRIKSIIRDMLTLRRWRSWAARNSFCAGDMFSCFTRGLKRLGVMTLHLLP